MHNIINEIVVLNPRRAKIDCLVFDTINEVTRFLNDPQYAVIHLEHTRGENSATRWNVFYYKINF
jgi:hypothetical protein